MDAFRDRYGPLADEGFVRQAYANTLRRPPDEDELGHWLAALDARLFARGSVMLALTESAEFTRRTRHRPTPGRLPQLVSPGRPLVLRNRRSGATCPSDP